MICSPASMIMERHDSLNNAQHRMASVYGWMRIGKGAGAYLHILCCDDLAGLGVQGGIDIDPEVKLQQAPKAFQDATIQVLVVLLLEQLLQAHDARLTFSTSGALMCSQKLVWRHRTR